MLPPLLFGAIAAFIGSIPITGPIAVLVMGLALTGRPREALSVAVGSSVAEAVWAGVAYAGIALVFGRWPWLAEVARAAGGALVFAIGVVLLRVGVPPLGDGRTRAGSFGLGVSVMAANVSVPAQWSAVCAIAAPWVGDGRWAPVEFGVGVALGAIGWYAIAVAVLTRVRLGTTSVRLVTRVSGGLLCVIGLSMLGAAIFG